MAHLIFNNDGYLIKIAANDSDKSNLNITESVYDVRSVSDADFNNVRLHKKTAKVVDDAIVYEDLAWSFGTAEDLKTHFKNNVMWACDSFLATNPSHPMKNSVLSYKQYVNGFDTSLITFPFEKSWEEYCNENSITFYHPLQIP